MAQYDAPTEEVVDNVANSNISPQNQQAIANLFQGQATVNVAVYDPANPPQNADLIIVPPGVQFTSDPGGAVVIFQGNAEVEFNAAAAEEAGRVIIAQSNDDQNIGFASGEYTLETGAGDDNITVNQGVSITMDTGYGFDTVNLGGNREDHTFEVDANGNVIVNGGNYVLTNVQVIQFDDHMSVVVANEDQAIVARMYKILFDRDPDSEGLQYWFDLLADTFEAGHHDMWDVTHAFMNSDEFVAMYGGKSDEEYLEALYQGMGRAPDEAGMNYWLDVINNPEEMIEGWTGDGDNAWVHVFYAFAYSDEASDLMGLNGNNYIIPLYDDDVA